MELVFLLCFVAPENLAVPMYLIFQNSSSLCLKTQGAILLINPALNLGDNRLGNRSGLYYAVKNMTLTDQPADRKTALGRSGRPLFRSRREFLTLIAIIAALGFLYVWQVLQPPPKPIYVCDVNGSIDPKNVELCKYAQ